MTKPFFDRLAMIDRAIEAGPEDCDFKRDIKKYFEEETSRSYFYENLQDPKWLEILSLENEFSEPPQSQKDPETGAISFTPWPQAQFLARMAAHAPDTVLEIILQIQSTDNTRVYEDLADAALELPPRQAAKLTPELLKWIELPYQMVLPEKMGKLMANMATIGEVDAAINLAAKLLAILPDPKAPAKDAEQEELRPSPDPLPRFDLWQYEEILKKYFSAILTAAPIPAFELLCDLLEDAVTLSQYPGEKTEPDDYSYIWRSAIEDHSQNLGLGIRNVLVSAVRDAAEQLIKSGSLEITVLVGILESRPWQIFHRLALHILRVFSEAAPELIAERLTDRERFSELGLRHEYYLLSKECFGRLTSEERGKILGWIEEGPDLSRFEGTDVELETHEDAKRYVRLWQRDRLEPIRDSLDKHWQDLYRKMIEELGPAEHPDFASVTTSWVGPTSPKEADDLGSMNIQEIVHFLRNWKPTGEPMDPSPEGLGRDLASVVSSNPERFAEKASSFQGLDPTYVRALLDGLREAAKQKKEDKKYQWLPVLELCSWVTMQPREMAEQKTHNRDRDYSWRSTRQTIAELLSAGFEKGPAEIPFALRNLVWKVLEPLTEDPEPTLEYEARYGGSNMDPASLSINTVRGQVMHTVIRYALWVRRYIEKTDNSEEWLAKGFSEMPEVREILDTHLDPSKEPTLTIRAVYGQWFPWLVLLDQQWAVESARTIFPTHEKRDELSVTAWETYIVFSQPYDNVFEILREQYSLAVELLEERPSESRLLADPDERLSEHLMTFYWRGKINIRDEDGLLSQFYRQAPKALRRHALEFVGRSLKNTKGDVPIEILERLKDLWNWRLFEIQLEGELAIPAEELSGFGWWFISAKFDDTWAIEQLKTALKLAGTEKHFRDVFKRLTELVATMPMQVVECLDMLNEGDKKGWQVYAHREQARTILNTAIQSGGNARQAAVELVNRFGARGPGFLDFRELLPENGT